MTIFPRRASATVADQQDVPPPLRLYEKVFQKEEHTSEQQKRERFNDKIKMEHICVYVSMLVWEMTAHQRGRQNITGDLLSRELVVVVDAHEFLYVHTVVRGIYSNCRIHPLKEHKLHVSTMLTRKINRIQECNEEAPTGAD